MLLTLLVTVLANFLMLFKLPFSQRISEYITKILVPRFFFGRYLRPLGVLIEGVMSTGVSRADMGVAGLEMADNGLGVRGKDAAGVWKA